MPGDDTGIEMEGSAAAGVGLYSGPASARTGVEVSAHPSHGVVTGTPMSAHPVTDSRPKRGFRTKAKSCKAKSKSRKY